MSVLTVAEKAELSLRLVREAPLIAYDTEGSGLDWKRNFPVGYVITTPENSVYVPIRHGGGGNLPDANIRVPETPTDPIVIHNYEDHLAAAFKERQRLGYKTVGHHLKFDCHFSANAGILLGRNLSCTQNREALLDEYARSYSLENSAERRGVEAKKTTGMYEHLARLFDCPATKTSMEHYWKLAGDDPIGVEYAEGDGVSTLQLWLKQQELITQQELEEVDRLEDGLIWTLYRIERRGIKVDVDYLHQTLTKIETEAEEIRNSFPEGFNPRSPIHMREYVTAAGRTDWPKTPKGNPSYPEKWLKTFDEGKKVVKLRKWTNLANTFVRPLIEEHVYNDRVHATLNQLKTEDYGTPARLSCSRPNLQQIPKRDKELATLFRKAFLPDIDHLFYEADYSQCEPRLFAHYSQEPSLVEGYSVTPFRDMHQVVADMLSVERDPTAKRMNMGILTGMYPKAFAGHMNWDVDKATQYWNQWFDAFPGIKNFQETASAVLKRRGFIKTLLGRRGRLEQARFAYRAVSKIIQGGNADILKWMMLEIDKMLEAEDDYVQLLMTVHDSIEWQAPEDDRGHAISEEIVRMMLQVQGEPFNLRVPFAVDLNKGRNWCEATFGMQEAA